MDDEDIAILQETNALQKRELVQDAFAEQVTLPSQSAEVVENCVGVEPIKNGENE